MGRKIVFNITKKGASHEISGKPCQDYSLSWESDDKQTQIVIVCDGHGGETYVRSDVGARLAAEIALSNIRDFISMISPSKFLDKSSAVTARPRKEQDSLFSSAHERKDKNLTEREAEQLAQDNAFYVAVENIREQDNLFTRLFASIYLQWIDAIKKDNLDNPFTEKEMSHLKNVSFVKAYGSTLMAYVRTSLYWFAFHIGDGKLVACDRNMKWCEPVPWDCNCFLNITTSLCNSDPIPMFRYAFSGKGDFPVAVILGSDGIDDSWGTMENLQNFYSQTLSIFNKLGEEQAIKELADYLPGLSRKASQDDMSIAGIIDMDEIGNAVAVYNVQRKLMALKQERERRESELLHLKEQYEKLKKQNEELFVKVESDKKSFSDWLKTILAQKDKKEKEILVSEDLLCTNGQEKENLRILYEEKKSEFQLWFTDAQKDKEIFDKEIDTLTKRNELIDREENKQWKNVREIFEHQENEKHLEILKIKSHFMEECNKEALDAMNAPIMEDDDFVSKTVDWEELDKKDISDKEKYEQE